MEPILFGQTSTTYELFRVGEQFQWIREDGEPLSPLFDSLEMAEVFSRKMPMFSAEQWKEYYPLNNDVKPREYEVK